jgi:uncharacterized membrane protein
LLHIVAFRAEILNAFEKLLTLEKKMKYTVEILINLPVAKVGELFDDPKNMMKWMKGLKSFEHLSGTSGQTGAKSKWIFENKMEMIETISKRNLPEEFSGTYDMKNMHYFMRNNFIDAGNGTTRYICYSEFKLSGLFMKSIAALMPGAFKKQSMKHLQEFKAFAESQK